MALETRYPRERFRYTEFSHFLDDSAFLFYHFDNVRKPAQGVWVAGGIAAHDHDAGVWSRFAHLANELTGLGIGFMSDRAGVDDD